MKLNKVLFLAPVAFLSLASCAIIRQRYKIEDYFINYTQAKNHKEIDDTGEFNILQLSDIHMSVMDDAKTHYKFMQKTIDEAKAIVQDKLHLIVITGDVFTFANKDTVKELCDFFESQDTPWTLTFGNHDEQGYFSIDWLTGYLTSLSERNSSNLLFKDMPNDDVFGSANFAINLPDNHRQIIMIDSNRYNYGQYYGYDSIHADQIDWYTRVANHAREIVSLSKETSKAVTSLAFFHIPVPEYLDAWQDASNNKENSTFLKGEKYIYNNGWPENPEPDIRNVHKDTSEGSPKINTGFFETARHIELDDNVGSYTKGMFVGHAHTNTNCMDYRPSDSIEDDNNSIALCYGVKATDRVYCDEEMMGGQLIHYFDSAADGSEAKKGSSWFTLDLIYHKYADLKDGE
ncbi:MAG: metallophosphoesterase [Bacilli bacterium]|nr:metallophosphoesterase [Bacilli bacterium]